MPGTISFNNAVNNTFANNTAINITAGDNAIINLALIINNLALTNQINALFPMSPEAFQSQREPIPGFSAPLQLAAPASKPVPAAAPAPKPVPAAAPAGPPPGPAEPAAETAQLEVPEEADALTGPVETPKKTKKRSPGEVPYLEYHMKYGAGAKKKPGNDIPYLDYHMQYGAGVPYRD